MAKSLRLMIPGGWMSSQDLRDLVGWAGSLGIGEVLAGDQQDWIVENATANDTPPPQRFLLRERGSVQCSAFGHFPDPATPWLSTGVWMDVLDQIADPGLLDIQLVHDSARPHFPRMGHLRLTAQREAHRWSLLVRRPGSNRVAQPAVDSFDTGSLAALVSRAIASWETGLEGFWEGKDPVVGRNDRISTLGRNWEGFHDENSDTFSFGLWSPRGRFRVERLRDLAWLGESGAPRAWLTPSRVLLFQGIPSSRRADWEAWVKRTAWAGRHSDLEHAVRVAGPSTEAQAARVEVLAHLRHLDRMPSQGLLVGDQSLNRGDGIAAFGLPVLVRASESWFWRSADGQRSGEGSLEGVLEDLARPARASSVPTVAPREALPLDEVPTSVYRCLECLTLYDPQWGDPQGGVAPQTPWSSLPAEWSCPVCGGPASGFGAQS